jgi:excisionase family DNA binding protein
MSGHHGLLGTMERNEKLLTAAMVAERLAVQRQQIWRWVRAGRLPVLHFGPRCYRFDPKDVDDLIREVRR